MTEMKSREFQIFVKPAGPQCNLACDYCYYLGKSALYDAGTKFRMPEEVLEAYIRQHIEATTDPVITFSWHGGEPLLAGIDFYRKALAWQHKYCPPGKKIINGMQTNGTLINEDWCRFLAEHNFVVGVSIDGPEALHNLFRKSANGQGTFARVLKGYDLLVMHGLDPEILCVLNHVNAKYPHEVYGFFKHLGAGFITFIPLVEPTGAAGGVSERTVNPMDFGRFMCTVFDEWLANDIGRLKVQLFEEALRTAFRQDHTLCIFKRECGGVPVVERNGDFYSCDHFVDTAHRVGNIADQSIAKMLDSEKQRLFGEAKRSTLPSYCLQCEVLDMCNGECPKNRISMTPQGEAGLNYLCAGYRLFFNHCRPFVEAVSKTYKGSRPNPETG
ncbi:MAG: anaerobic sulfatase maturase [Bacteroidales bacterium]|nr:anaerobic sulfatase maturase [Bacteroidales bacterium]